MQQTVDHKRNFTIKKYPLEPTYSIKKGLHFNRIISILSGGIYVLKLLAFST